MKKNSSESIAKNADEKRPMARMLCQARLRSHWIIKPWWGWMWAIERPITVC
jgi:hypothetical protein